MATRDDIPTDLALEIGDDLEPGRFVSACKEFFGLTKELTVSPGSEDLRWRVKVREGSNIIALAPNAEANVLRATIERMRLATDALAAGDFEFTGLTEKAIQHAKRLSDLTKAGKHVVPMRLWFSRVPMPFGPEIGELIRQEESGSYDDFGTLEGTLKAISDQVGGLEIRIHDPLWNRAIPCRVLDEQIDDAMAAFRKRVEVTGLIHYNQAGRPTSIRMESLTPLPDDRSLPTVADVRGMFASNA
ncbi:MAG: hypothetical protein AAGH43_08385 [Pseudomonadota bacterium]